MSEQPTFDLQAFRASQAEAVHEPFTVILGVAKDDDGTEHNETIGIPPLKVWTLEAQGLMAEGDILGAFELVLGLESTDLFRKYQWKLGEFEALSDALGKWSGFKMGQPGSQRLPGHASIRK